MELSFLGAAGTVTGSKFLVEAGGTRILVDCGLYQGVKKLRLRNWAELPIRPAEIEAVVLSHAHIDHSGYLPKLVADGFRGRVFASPPTVELAGILLPDAGHLQEEDAAYANRKGVSKHRPALPLFDEAAARVALDHLEPLEFGEKQRIGELEIQLSSAGHILGAASVGVSHRGRSLLFSGDLGRDDDLLMRPPAGPGSPDWIVVESTYGDRLHPALDPLEEVAAVMKRTFARGGTLLIPSFAVGRAQTLLYSLHEIFARGLAPRVPVYVNSPMATDVTHLYRRFHAYHRLAEDQCHEVCDVAEYVGSVEESRQLALRRGPMVIVSASGMATGGRVLHHLKALAPDHRNTVLLPGFQAPGTRGDSLASGAREIKIHGSYVEVRAEVVKLDCFSAHADQRGLLDWLGACTRAPRAVFVVHGEPAPGDAMRRRIQEDLGCAAHLPEYLERVELAASGSAG
jgi:metallo-beta-lactamase family protein